MNPGGFGFPKRGGVVADAVRFGVDQFLASLQRLQALRNIGAVGYLDAQGLSAPQSLLARQNVLAASVDAATSLGLLVNPAFEISQERGASSVSIANAGPYVVDQWQVFCGGTMALSAQQVANPFAVDGFRRIRNGLRVTVTTAQASLGAGDVVLVDHRLEGNILQPLGLGTADARGVDVAMVVQSSISGTFSVVLRNAAAALSYVANFTVAANTPTVVFVPVAAITSGTWPTDNSHAATVSICLGTGSTFQTGTPGVWVGGNFIGTSATTNFAATNGATFTIGFAQAFPAGVLPFTSAGQITGENLARLLSMKRRLDDEIRLAQRYWYRTAAGTISFPARVKNFGASAFNVGFGAPHPVPMRAAPSMSVVWEINDVVQGGAPPFLGATIHAWDATPSIAAGGDVDVTQVTGNARM